MASTSSCARTCCFTQVQASSSPGVTFNRAGRCRYVMTSAVSAPPPTPLRVSGTDLKSVLAPPRQKRSSERGRRPSPSRPAPSDSRAPPNQSPVRFTSPLRHRPEAPQHPGSSAADKLERQVYTSFPGFLGGSHTQPANCGLAAHGCYRVVGPARIQKRGDCLVARMLPGSRLEIIDSSGQATRVQVATSSHRASADGNSYANGDGVGAASAAVYGAWGSAADDIPCACISGDDVGCSTGSVGEEEDGAVAECILVGAHVELGGSASSVDTADMTVKPAVCHRNGRTYLSVRSLPAESVITLGADAVVSHPVNVTPPEVSSESFGPR